MPKLTLARADITTLPLDAIVNAANCFLLGGSGVDGAIHRAAGPSLLEECKALPQHPPGSGIRCPEGEARITGGHRLPARYIIHTVGPVWSDKPEHDDPLLAACYRNSLRLAAEHHCGTIAFPAISCGVFGYPIERACRVAVKTVKAELAKLKTITQVTLVAFDDEIEEAYRELLD